MMMALGFFVFSLHTAAYQELQRQLAWRHASVPRVGDRPASQYIGPDDETITLAARLLPALTGGRLTIAMLQAMASTGKAFPLIEGTGLFYGLFVIESIDTKASVFFRDGAARAIDCTVSLKRVGDDDIDLLATAGEMLSLVGL